MLIFSIFFVFVVLVVVLRLVLDLLLYVSTNERTGLSFCAQGVEGVMSSGDAPALDSSNAHAASSPLQYYRRSPSPPPPDGKAPPLPDGKAPAPLPIVISYHYYLYTRLLLLCYSVIDILCFIVGDFVVVG